MSAEVSEADANEAAAIAVAASSGARYAEAKSHKGHGQPTSLLSTSAPEPSSRSFLDPLGIVEKVQIPGWRVVSSGHP